MNRSALLSLIFLLVCGCTTTSLENCESINRFTTVINEYPKRPHDDGNTDAPLAGNGDIGVTMCASKERLRFYIGKNDFWRAYPEHLEGSGPALPGGFDIKADIISDGKYSAMQIPGTAMLKAIFEKDGNTLDIASWVSATDNLFVIEMTSSERMVLTLDLWSPEGYGSVNDCGREDGVMWVTRSLGEPPVVDFSSDIAIAVNLSDSTLVLEPGKTNTIVLAAYTNHDTDSWKQTAIKRAASFNENVLKIQRSIALKRLRNKHLQWWNSFWGESSVEFADEELEYWYYTSQYLFACSSRSGKFAPGLWGPFITEDWTAWNGDYHLNYNYEAPYWHCYSSNHLSLTDNYDQPILDFMPTGRILAQTHLGCNGVLYPVGISPKGSTCTRWPKDPDDPCYDVYPYYDPPLEDGYMYWGQKTDAAFAAANMLMRFYSTYDKEYARKVYPFVAACADFYADYCKERDGRYVILDDTFYEEMPWGDHLNDYNSITALGLARMSFRGALCLSEFLGLDEDRRSRWSYVESRLADYPIGTASDGTPSLKNIQRLSEDGKDKDVPATGLNRVILHGLVLPAGLVGPNLDPELCDILYRDMERWKAEEGNDWGDSLGNGFETVYAGAIRIGFPAKDVIKYMKDRIAMLSYPNGYVKQYGGGVETFAGVPLAINEMFLQSYEGIVRVFPNWDNSIDASFENLRAYGGFLVSASIQSGEINKVRIFSEKGRPCVLQNPWSGEIESFPTEVGGVIVLTHDKK